MLMGCHRRGGARLVSLAVMGAEVLSSVEAGVGKCFRLSPLGSGQQDGSAACKCFADWLQ